MNTKIFVISHKNIQKPEVSGYYSLLVGAARGKADGEFDFRDDVGENISLLNSNFCELTGLYWIWKNQNTDNVGICHYRRFFSNAAFSASPKKFVSDKEAEQILSKYDVIVPKTFYSKKSVWNSLNVAPNKEDMLQVEKAIQTISPEYFDEYKNFLNDNKNYLYNMVITKKELFNAYCEWLFKILFYIRDNYDISAEDSYRSRLFGFLSERLFRVWLLKNVSKEKIKEVRVVNTDVGATRDALRRAKNIYRNIKFKLTK